MQPNYGIGTTSMYADGTRDEDARCGRVRSERQEAGMEFGQKYSVLEPGQVGRVLAGTSCLPPTTTTGVRPCSLNHESG